MARALIEQRLAACAHVCSPVTSCYRWEGKVEREAEWLLTAKTQSVLFDKIAALVAQHHPYDLPAITATQMLATEVYAKWVLAETEGE